MLFVAPRVVTLADELQDSTTPDKGRYSHPCVAATRNIHIKEPE
jgi:hypothetical protein